MLFIYSFGFILTKLLRNDTPCDGKLDQLTLLGLTKRDELEERNKCKNFFLTITRKICKSH